MDLNNGKFTFPVEPKLTFFPFFYYSTKNDYEHCPPPSIPITNSQQVDRDGGNERNSSKFTNTCPTSKRVDNRSRIYLKIKDTIMYP